MLSCAGGAAGGGYAQVIPMEEVRQHWRQQNAVPWEGWAQQSVWSSVWSLVTVFLESWCGLYHLHVAGLRCVRTVAQGWKATAQFLDVLVTPQLLITWH